MCDTKQLGWNDAITDAEGMIKELKEKVARLRRAIRAFEAMRDTGEPWPGTSEAQGATHNERTRTS